MKQSDCVYVLHQYGAPTHYNALVELGKIKGFNVKFRIFSPKAIFASCYHGRFKIALKSIWFLVSLMFRRPVTIVIGIAPFDKYLIPLSWLLKFHKVYYHTSYTHWDGSMMAYPTNNKKLLKRWHFFVNQQVKHIFAVSENTKKELIKNGYSSSERITVVNHSYTSKIEAKIKTKDNSFIFVGRLSENKGISELLEIFSNRQNATLTIVGNGELEYLVKEYASNCNNIKHLGYVKGLENLIPIYSKHSFLIMNSKRSSKWEELFGISIIEGMACGCVPITTNHPGPLEIITPEINGFIAEEGNIAQEIDKAILMYNEKYQIMRKNAIKRGGDYTTQHISDRWRIINC